MTQCIITCVCTCTFGEINIIFWSQKSAHSDISADMDKTNPKLYHLRLQLQDVSKETAIFIAKKHEKTNSNLYNYFLHFNFFPRHIKNQIETMIYFQKLSIELKQLS